MITYNHIHKPSMCELARPAGPRRRGARASIMDSTLYFMSLTHPSRCDWAYTDALHRPTHTTDARVSVRYRHSTTWIITVHAARRRPDMTQRQTQCPTKVLCFTFQHYFRRLHQSTYSPHAMCTQFSIQCRSCLYNTVWAVFIRERDELGYGFIAFT